jgi:hypothetical protein
VQSLQGDPSSQSRRLLRVLFVRIGEVPADPAAAQLLWLILAMLM